MREFLFTYGLLKRRYSSNPIYKVPPMPIKHIGKGLYPGRLFRVAHYPGVRFQPENSKGVTGDVYEITNPFFLTRMDAYELSAPTIKFFHEYKRVKRPILIQGQTIECWVYEYQGRLLPFNEIFSGNF